MRDLKGFYKKVLLRNSGYDCINPGLSGTVLRSLDCPVGFPRSFLEIFLFFPMRDQWVEITGRAKTVRNAPVCNSQRRHER